MLEKKNIQKINRYFRIIEVLLLSTPFIAYLYCYSLSATHMISLQEVIVSNPHIAIVFLISMINPYIAYLFNLIQKKLKDGHVEFVCINFILLMIAQACTMNLLYLMMMVYLFFLILKTYNINVFKILKTYTLRYILFQGGGSFIVIVLSTICLFSSMRLM